MSKKKLVKVNPPGSLKTTLVQMDLAKLKELRKGLLRRKWHKTWLEDED